MSVLITSEIVSAFALLVGLAGLLMLNGKNKATRFLVLVCVLGIFWNLIDASSYACDAWACPDWIKFAINYLTFIIGGFGYILFSHYCHELISEKVQIKKWIFLLPAIIMLAGNTALSVWIFMGKAFIIKDGIYTQTEGLPIFVFIVNIVLSLYLPIVAWTKRKYVGNKTAYLLGFYGIMPPIATLVMLLTGGYDFSPVGCSLSILIISTILEYDKYNEARENDIIALNSSLDLVNTLSRDYLNVYIIDPNKNTVKIQKLDGYVTEGISKNRKKYRYDELINNYIKNRVYEEDVPMMTEVMSRDNISRVLTQIDQLVGTYRVLDNGEIHYYQYKYVKIDGSDSIIAAFQNVDSMIAVEKENQDKLQKALEAAEHANISKSIFLNNMSHDIRTPMNAILGFAKLMEGRKNEPEVVSEYLSKIEESGQYLLSIINNVLDMARIESGKMELNFSPTDMGDENTAIMDLFADEIKRKHLTFTHSLNVTHRYALADGPRLSQIMVNLISNAIKYTPDGGSIKVENYETECDREGYVNYHMLVSDTGIGMSDEFREQIFDAFTRERTSTESQVIGTGLGMSIVKKLVELMEGSIEVESQVGKGSTFHLTFPLKPVESGEVSSQNMDESIGDVDFTGKRILLAEDNDINAMIINELLKSYGITVERAADGVECIDMLTKVGPGYYDMIFMDIQMPNLNGYDATRRIRCIEDRTLADIPIVAMTANAFEEDRRKALEAGMNDHLAKPIEIPKLLKTMKQYLK